MISDSNSWNHIITDHKSNQHNIERNDQKVASKYENTSRDCCKEKEKTNFFWGPSSLLFGCESKASEVEGHGVEVIVGWREEIEIEGQRLRACRCDVAVVVIHDRGRGPAVAVAVLLADKDSLGRRVGLPPAMRRPDVGRRGRRGYPGPAEGFHGATEAAARRPLRWRGRRRRVTPSKGESRSGGGAEGRDGRWRRGRGARKVGLSLRPPEGDGGGVVGPGGVLGGVEGAEPHPGFLPGIPDLGRKPPPRPLPDAAVPNLHRHRRGSRSLSRSSALPHLFFNTHGNPMIGSSRGEEANRWSIKGVALNSCISNPAPPPPPPPPPPCNQSASEPKEDLECSNSFLHQSINHTSPSPPASTFPRPPSPFPPSPAQTLVFTLDSFHLKVRYFSADAQMTIVPFPLYYDYNYCC